MKTILVENISKTIDDVSILDRVSFKVEEGELFFILGPSGCGKTTLLRIIAGLEKPDSGRVIVGGSDITDLPPEKRKTALVFQNYALWPHMTVEETIRWTMKLGKVRYKDENSKISEILSVVQLEKMRKRKPASLSGGEQQRVALARALCVNPDCLLLDEPLSNLDAGLRLEMRNEIRKICKEMGVTTIYVTHDQKEALSVADRIAVMNNGRMEQIATPQQIYSKPATEFVANFVGEANFFNAVVSRLPVDRSDEYILEVGRKSLRAKGKFPGLNKGENVKVCIRPEKISIIEEGQKTEGNILDGIVKQVIFLGESIQYQVHVEEAGLLKVLETNKGKRKGEGKSVLLYTDPEDISVFRL